LSYRNVSKTKALSIKEGSGWSGLSRKNGLVAKYVPACRMSGAERLETSAG